MPRLGTMAFYLVIWVISSVGLVHAGQTGRSGDPRGPLVAQSPTKVAPRAVFPQMKYSFGEVFEGNEVKHDFIVENQGDAPLVIKNIRPD